MAKSKALLAAEQRIAALEAQLVVANEACANQRMRIAALEAAINTRGTKPAPVVTHYTDRFGRVWGKGARGQPSNEPHRQRVRALMQ